MGLTIGDMHHAAVAIEELWAERPGARTPREVAEKLRWLEQGPDVEVRIGGSGDPLHLEGRPEPEVSRAAAALEAAVEHELIQAGAVRADP